VSPPKLIDFPAEAHEAPELEVMLAGCATDAERKAVREAFYTFAQGDPGAFAVQLAVLLMAHARALKTAPEAFRKTGERVSSEVIEAIASHRLSVKEAAAVLSKEAANVGHQAALAGQDLCQLREELSKCSGALRNIFAGIIDGRRAIHAAAESLESISERRILIGLTAAFVVGAASCGLALWIWRLVCAF
jgi:hypothetical protein